MKGEIDETFKEYGITDNKSGLTDKEASEIISLLSDGRRSSEIEGGLRKGFIESLNSIKENYLSNQVNYPSLKVYTFSPFGYEGTIVQVEKYHYFRSYIKIGNKYFELRLDTEEKTGKKIGELPAPVYISKKRMTNGKLNSPQNISPINHRNKYKNRCSRGCSCFT